MFIHQLELFNFRCFEALTVPLDRYLNVFVGSNGAGKTALLDGISLALTPILSHLPFKHKFRIPTIVFSDIHLIGEDRSAPFVHVAVSGETDGHKPISWGLTETRDQSPATKAQRPLGLKDLSDLTQFLDQIINAHNADESYTLPVFAYYGTNRAINLPDHSLRQPLDPDHFRRLGGLEFALYAMADFRRAINVFDFLEQRELREQRDGVIRGSLPALDCVRRAINLMIPSIRNPRIDGTTGRFTIDTTDPNGTEIKLDLDQLSDGYQVMLGVVMDFALRLALANPPEKTGKDPLASEAILMIDEVDLHLHPAWQQRVILDLRQTFPNTQLVLTTHSPQVISTVHATSIRAIRLDDGKTRIDTPTFQTRGVESTDVLANIMRVDPVPQVPEAKWLSDYRAMIEEGSLDSQQAIELRTRLVTHFGERHPLMLDCERLIRFAQFKRRKAEARGDNNAHT